MIYTSHHGHPLWRLGAFSPTYAA